MIKMTLPRTGTIKAALTATAASMLVSGCSGGIFQPDTRRLVFDAAVIIAVGAAVAVFLYLRTTRRIRQLIIETERMQRGEPLNQPPSGSDPICILAAAVHRMGKHFGNLRRAIDEHAIVAFTDPQGRITFVNDRFCEISGYPRNELLGKTHRVINSARHTGDFFREMWKTIGSGKVWRGDIENRAKNGSHYFVATTIVPCPGPDGRPEQYIAIRTDITGQKAAAERLRQLSLELEAKNADLETLIHAASHDLRSPLVNVHGFASLIGEHAETARKLLQEAAAGRPPSSETAETAAAEMEEAVHFIQAGAEKMDALLKGLLIFSRMGRAAPAMVPVEAGAILHDCLAATRFQLEESGARVTAGPLPCCLAETGLLGQIFSNLIDNAIKYRDPRHPLQITISGSTEGDRAVCRFIDNGIGIDPQHRDKVFELFHRLNPRHGDGHGIGLAIVRRALDLMNGTVAIEPAEGGGTVFVVSLPAVRS